jgi:hypothetical protein
MVEYFRGGLRRISSAQWLLELQLRYVGEWYLQVR